MTDKSNRRITIPQGGGFFKDISLRLKLILRLMGDSRVNSALKLMPIGSLVYLVLPTDILPINPIDDAVIVWLATYLFVELCPPDVVQEHLEALNATRKVMNNYQETSNPDMEGEIIDAEIIESDGEEK
jgi:uncharacterized membrane protein YkvA (DUF1232 family)